MEQYLVIAGSVGENTITVWWHGGNGFNVYTTDMNGVEQEVDHFTYYGKGGAAPTERKARQLMEDYIFGVEEEYA